MKDELSPLEQNALNWVVAEPELRKLIEEMQRWRMTGPSRESTYRSIERWQRRLELLTHTGGDDSVSRR